MPTVQILSGTVPATHQHPTYGPCVVLYSLNFRDAMIRTSTGTALVPRSTLVRL
jgi:hypothetical protein